MLEFEKKVANIKEKMESYIFHPYLREYIVPPTIDDDKLLILMSIVEQLDLPPFEKDTYVMAIMLMYVALDTHDNVTNDLVDQGSVKVRQLTVLAGDYYSGLYYKFLSEVGDIHLIKALSEGVKDINEHKVRIYQKRQVSLDMIMKSVEMVEFSLIAKLMEYFGLSNWNNSTSNFLLFKRLLKEQKQFEEQGSSILFSALDHLYFPVFQQKQNRDHYNELMVDYENYIESVKKLMINGLDHMNFLNDLLRNRIVEVSNVHYPREKSFVEEG